MFILAIETNSALWGSVFTYNAVYLAMFLDWALKSNFCLLQSALQPKAQWQQLWKLNLRWKFDKIFIISQKVQESPNFGKVKKILYYFSLDHIQISKIKVHNMDSAPMCMGWKKLGWKALFLADFRYLPEYRILGTRNSSFGYPFHH